MPAAEVPSVLSHWSLQSGVGFLLAIPLVQTEMVILSEETQLVGVFSIFVALAYQGSSEYLSDLFDERKKTVRDARATPHALASLRSAALAFPFPHTLFPLSSPHLPLRSSYRAPRDRSPFLDVRAAVAFGARRRAGARR